MCTGLMLLQCSDSVAWGKWGSTNYSLVERFHAAPGTRFTVECPTRCVSALPMLYGCNMGPYMDVSAICKAAVAAGVAGDKELSIFTFVIDEPREKYKVFPLEFRSQTWMLARPRTIPCLIPCPPPTFLSACSVAGLCELWQKIHA